LGRYLISQAPVCSDLSLIFRSTLGRYRISTVLVQPLQEEQKQERHQLSLQPWLRQRVEQLHSQQLLRLKVEQQLQLAQKLEQSQLQERRKQL